MQTVIEVVCAKGASLREAIGNDDPRRLARFGLEVLRQHQPGRPHGWAKLHSTRREARGAMNLQWDADTSILLCRVVNRGTARPALIAGDFVAYLLARWRRRVQSIHIFPGR